MKKNGIGVALLLTLFVTACSDHGEKKAVERLEVAEKALSIGDFREEKLQIDSIRIRDPKDFEAGKQGIARMEQVELEEEEKSVV